MKITDYEKNHGKFVHEDWLQKIINLVPNLVQLTDAKSIEAIHFENDVTLVDYINQDGELVEGEPVASYLNANVTGDGSMGHIKTISFLNVYGEPTVLAGIELQDYDPNVPYKTFNFDDSIRYAFDNSSDKFIATDTKLGVVKFNNDDPIRVDKDGTLKSHLSQSFYTDSLKNLAIRPATGNLLGGVKPDGKTVNVDSNGIISAAQPAPFATYTKLALTAPNTTFTIDESNTNVYLKSENGVAKYIVGRIVLNVTKDTGASPQGTLVTLSGINIDFKGYNVLSYLNGSYPVSTYPSLLDTNLNITGYPAITKAEISQIMIPLNLYIGG